MSGMAKAFGHNDRTKYVRLARLRTIQKASLLLVLAISAAFFFFRLPGWVATALCWLSIAASLCGVASLAAYHRTSPDAFDQHGNIRSKRLPHS